MYETQIKYLISLQIWVYDLFGQSFEPIIYSIQTLYLLGKKYDIDNIYAYTYWYKVQSNNELTFSKFFSNFKKQFVTCLNV